MQEFNLSNSGIEFRSGHDMKLSTMSHEKMEFVVKTAVMTAAVMFFIVSLVLYIGYK